MKNSFNKTCNITNMNSKDLVKKTSIARKIKLLLDIPVSFIAILILLPFFILLIVIIRIDSKGSPFFLQKRLGLFGKPYRIIKFRTMVLNAENIGDKMRITTYKDPRITRVGRFLRKTSLDELPQLFNVLKGDMALVGPRPTLTYHPYVGVDNFPEWAKPRFLIRPGLTGLAQVKVRNSVSWDERIKYDIKYINNLSILKDLYIIGQTIIKIIKPENMYLNPKK